MLSTRTQLKWERPPDKPEVTLPRSRKWNRAERIYHLPMRDILPKLIRANGSKGAAKVLGVSEYTIHYWCLRLNLKRITLMLGPDEEVAVRKIEDQGDKEKEEWSAVPVMPED
jgi:hypothetical protein